jgi:hypothetical protein
MRNGGLKAAVSHFAGLQRGIVATLDAIGEGQVAGNGGAGTPVERRLQSAAFHSMANVKSSMLSEAVP